MTTILQTSEDIMERQRQVNAKITRDYESSLLHNITIADVARDIGEAVHGIPSDLFGNTGAAKTWEVFIVDNRLRGVGVLMMAVAAVFLIV